MASIPPNVADNSFLAAMSNTLASDIRALLKEPLMVLAEQQVDEAVDKAVAAIQIRIDAWVNAHELDTTIKFVIEKRAVKP